MKRALRLFPATFVGLIVSVVVGTAYSVFTSGEPHRDASAATKQRVLAAIIAGALNSSPVLAVFALSTATPIPWRPERRAPTHGAP